MPIRLHKYMYFGIFDDINISSFKGSGIRTMPPGISIFEKLVNTTEACASGKAITKEVSFCIRSTPLLIHRASGISTPLVFQESCRSETCQKLIDLVLYIGSGAARRKVRNGRRGCRCRSGSSGRACRPGRASCAGGAFCSCGSFRTGRACRSGRTCCAGSAFRPCGSFCTGWPCWACRARGAFCSCRSGCSHCPCYSCRPGCSGFPRRPGWACCSGWPGRASWACWAGSSGRSRDTSLLSNSDQIEIRRRSRSPGRIASGHLVQRSIVINHRSCSVSCSRCEFGYCIKACTGSARRASWTCCSGRSGCSCRPRRSCRSGCSSYPYSSGSTGCSGRSGWTSWACRTRKSDRPFRPHRPLLASWSSRTRTTPRACRTCRAGNTSVAAAIIVITAAAVVVVGIIKKHILSPLSASSLLTVMDLSSIRHIGVRLDAHTLPYAFSPIG